MQLEANQGQMRSSVRNMIGEKHGLFCNTHKKVNMINIFSSICEFIGCNTTSSFNYQGLKISDFVVFINSIL